MRVQGSIMLTIMWCSITVMGQESSSASFLGIIQTPVIQSIEQRKLAWWFSMTLDVDIHDSDYHSTILPTNINDINVDLYKEILWKNQHTLHIGKYDSVSIFKWKKKMGQRRIFGFIQQFKCLQTETRYQ